MIYHLALSLILLQQSGHALIREKKKEALPKISTKGGEIWKMITQLFILFTVYGDQAEINGSSVIKYII